VQQFQRFQLLIQKVNRKGISMDTFIKQLILKLEVTIYTRAEEDSVRLRIEDIAREGGLSRFQLQRYFKKETGVNLSGYLQQLRVNTAVNIVCLTKAQLLDAALSLGYSGQQSFTRAFTR
jgi:AraC-like DNA-binding protein